MSIARPAPAMSSWDMPGATLLFEPGSSAEASPSTCSVPGAASTDSSSGGGGFGATGVLPRLALGPGLAALGGVVDHVVVRGIEVVGGVLRGPVDPVLHRHLIARLGTGLGYVVLGSDLFRGGRHR